MTPIQNIEWSTRASNVLASTHITTLEELCSCDINTVMSARASGVKTVRELLRGCLSKFVKPSWLDDIHKISRGVENESGKGFVTIAGPYNPGEYGMLEVALAALWPIETKVIQGHDGLYIHRSTQGYIPIDDEEDKL